MRNFARRASVTMTPQNHGIDTHTKNTKEIPIKEAVDSFLLSCKVEGRSHGTIDCYTDKLKGFPWYTRNYDWPDDINAITTNHLREFLAYLRDTPHRFSSDCPRAQKPINSHHCPEVLPSFIGSV